MHKRAAFGVLAFFLLAGCEGPDAVVSEAQTSAPAPEPTQETASATAQAPAPAPATPIVGCWVKVTPAATETISINDDGTCSDVVVAPRTIDGVTFMQTFPTDCTWTARDSSALTFVYPTSAPLCTYIIDGDALTLLCPYMHEPQTYQRGACN
jgi:hypothetical protein